MIKFLHKEYPLSIAPPPKRRKLKAYTVIEVTHIFTYDLKSRLLLRVVFTAKQ